MKISTGTGDDGTTSFGKSGRVSKDDLWIEVLGCVDELSSALGFAACAVAEQETAFVLRTIQGELFAIAPALMQGEREGEPLFDQGRIETQIAELEEEIELHGFVLPGGTEASARIDLARTATRRLERRLVALSRRDPVPPELLAWVNRLGDLLFLMARDEEGPSEMISWGKNFS